MNNAKPVTVSFIAYFKLSTNTSPKTDEEMEHMSSVPYLSPVGSIMYAMICNRPDISHTVSVVSRYMESPGKEHWAEMSHSIVSYGDSKFAGDLDKRRSEDIELLGWVLPVVKN
ncbi:hypothetical protein GH714_019977 [Hevea brasiliensis]|uniref:Reverse transcriptase Ty1/copia-type domain-containing protein n=1 Tax=Hevea brasiliensis TaxID=3981 RepID=A0A6A6L0H6_HEVBR|nr:hypothetical protein GH714_019977 [Hevea brasiliensis]